MNLTPSSVLSFVRAIKFPLLPCFASVTLLFLFTLGIVGFFLPTPLPDLSRSLSPPYSLTDWGYDPLGRSLGVLIIQSYSTIMRIVLPAAFLSALIGVPLGIVAGFRMGWLDLVIMRLVDLFLAFPGILIAIFLASVLGPGAKNLILALALFGWTGFARLCRGEILRLKGQPFIEAAHSQGIPLHALYWKHFFPHLLPVLIVQMIFSIQGGILAEASLSFLGLSDPQTPSLGKLLSEGVRVMRSAPYLTLIPGLFLFLTLYAVYELGDYWVQRLNRRLDLP